MRFHSPGGISVSAVRQISFKIGRGEVVGLVGESGCGKSTTALSLGRLLPPEKSAVSGSLKLRGRELLDLREKELEKVRGTEIAYVFQEPSLALHPLQRVRDQVSDVIRVHRHWSRKRCRDEAREMLRAVGLPDSERFSSAYPHQLSGGQRQRVVVALALACQPALIVADEPTASLDVLTQAEILSLFRQLKEKLGVAMLLITHNPAILVGLADRILVMYAGKIVEEGPFEEVIQEPLHPYTQGLLRSMLVAPAKINHSLKEALPEILGQPPDPSCLPAGCAFEPRCPERMNVCASQNPATASPRADREVSCFLYGGD
ncbi:MAG: ABC transporter ATP-binding protein [Candidatus Acidiferrales bacterium]